MALSPDPRLPQLEPTKQETDFIDVKFWRRYQERFYTLWRELASNTDQIRGSVQGSSVASTNNLAVAKDVTLVHVTGTTQINLIDNTNFYGGAEITFIFDSTPTVKHNQAASGRNRPVLLNGAVDLVAAANNTLTLKYDSTNDQFYEVGRKV